MSVEPRILWVPSCARSLGPDAIAWWEAAGGVLYGWQQDAVNRILGLDEGDRWASLEDGLNVARQNGKGVVLQVIEGFCAFELGYPVVMHTAHEFATALEHQLRLEQFIQDCPHLHARVKDRGGYKHANGQESINLKSGVRIAFKARTRGGGRGWSGDLLVWDEAMEIPDTVVGAQMPTLRRSESRHGPKIIYSGSAVDQEVHAYGVTFARIRERGMRQEPGVSYQEWSAPFEHPSEMTDDLLQNRNLWPLPNPSMETGLPSEDHMQREINSMPARTAAVELFGVGDWPATDGSTEYVIHIDAWDGCRDDDSVVQGQCVLAFDVSPERRSAVALAGWNQDGKLHVEIQEDRLGTGWLAARLIEMCDSGIVDEVVCDGVGPAASLVPVLEDAGLRVRTFTTPEHGQACGRLVDLVAGQELAHLGSDELRDAIRGAKARPLGDAWAWSRKSSSVNIAPLVAATLALSAAASIADAVQVF